MVNQSPNFIHAKIYQLTSPHIDDVYVGATTQPLIYRFKQHQSSYKAYKKGNGNYVSSFELFELGDVIIELIEEYPCKSRVEMYKREQYHMNSRVCINKNQSFLTETERRNKEKLRYYMNRDLRCEKMRECNNQRVVCKECKKPFTKGNKTKHIKSKFHQRQSEPDDYCIEPDDYCIEPVEDEEEYLIRLYEHSKPNEYCSSPMMYSADQMDIIPNPMMYCEDDELPVLHYVEKDVE